MSAAITAARALTTGTMIAATAATVGIGVHLASAHAATSPATQAAQTYQRFAREGEGERRSHDDDGGLLGGLLQGSTSTGQSGTSSSVTGGANSQTRTRGS